MRELPSIRSAPMALAFAALAVSLSPPAAADPDAFAAMRADAAVAKYGVTGAGVTVAILDRGIDTTHPDFIKPDGTTRIKWLLDMTGQNLCQGGATPIEYTEAQINAALSGGPALPTRDAVGHGTVTTGIAAGNGRAFANGKYRGLAPDADLIIVKVTSEGAPAHSGQPAETGFQGCYDEALDWLDAKITASGKPCVALINSGVQWGPMDGTSAISRKIDQVFGLDRPGRVYVSSSGDEGGLPTHARTIFSAQSDGTVRFNKRTTATTFLTMWYTGAMPGLVSVTFDNGVSSGEVGPTACGGQNNITICQYPPGQAFYPWRSTGPDRAVWIRIVGRTGPGTIRLKTTSPGTGTVDFYTGDYPYVAEFTEKLAPGRLNDYSTTKSAVVIGAEVLRHAWVDINGVTRTQTDTGTAGMLWSESSGGPTRDGRAPGVDVTTPGHGIFAAYARNSYWASFPHLLVNDGGGWYGRAGATSAAGPLGVGAVALMLQMDPTLTARKVKDILHATARQDAYTGAVPNNDWGYGKLDMLAALDMVSQNRPFTMDDARLALRVAAGLEARTAGSEHLDLVTNGTSNGRLDLSDAMAILRRASGP